MSALLMISALAFLAVAFVVAWLHGHRRGALRERRLNEQAQRFADRLDGGGA